MPSNAQRKNSDKPTIKGSPTKKAKTIKEEDEFFEDEVYGDNPPGAESKCEFKTLVSKENIEAAANSSSNKIYLKAANSKAGIHLYLERGNEASDCYPEKYIRDIMNGKQQIPGAMEWLKNHSALMQVRSKN